MRRFQFEFGDKPWPPDTGVVQVYALVSLDGNPELRELVRRVREVAEASDVPLSPVPDDGLHITLDLVAGRTSERIPGIMLETFVAMLTKRLADFPGYLGFAGSPLSYNGSVALDVAVAAPLRQLQGRVRGIVRDVFTTNACAWKPTKPHVTTHYCCLPDGEEAKSDPLQRELRQIDPGIAPLRVDKIAVVEVRPDLEAVELRWSAIGDPIPLAEPKLRLPGSEGTPAERAGRALFYPDSAVWDAGLATAWHDEVLRAALRRWLGVVGGLGSGFDHDPDFSVEQHWVQMDRAADEVIALLMKSDVPAVDVLDDPDTRTRLIALGAEVHTSAAEVDWALPGLRARLVESAIQPAPGA